MTGQIIGKLVFDAQECRISWTRTSFSPARTRMDCEAPLWLVMCLRGIAPGTTQRLSFSRSRVASRPTLNGANGTPRSRESSKEARGELGAGRHH